MKLITLSIATLIFTAFATLGAYLLYSAFWNNTVSAGLFKLDAILLTTYILIINFYSKFKKWAV
ncbi:hypothetical protein AAIP58_000096 [Flavobacterium psychrophilum]|nr:hypothetical protein [Flavobacterium psychrophilum]EKT4545827.1 hypothetical protein [Flavobacterium psychrophilum]